MLECYRLEICSTVLLFRAAGGESLTMKDLSYRNAAHSVSTSGVNLFSTLIKTCVPRERRWRAHWLEISELQLPPVRRLREADVEPCL
jgi:hypothetical protein